MESSCTGRGAHIKEQRGRKWLRAGHIEKERRGSEPDHRVFESSSWDPDDRVVFGNLRARAQKWVFPSTEDWARKEGFGFQSVHSFIYITYFHRQDSFKGRRGLFSDFQYALASVFYFPTLSPTMYLFPEQRSPRPCLWALCLLLKDTVRVLLLNVERVMGGFVIVLPHLFSSGVCNQKGIANGTMAQRPWNKCMMKGMVSTPQRHQALLLKVLFVYSLAQNYWQWKIVMAVLLFCIFIMLSTDTYWTNTQVFRENIKSSLNKSWVESFTKCLIHYFTPWNNTCLM